MNNFLLVKQGFKLLHVSYMYLLLPVKVWGARTAVQFVAKLVEQPHTCHHLNLRTRTGVDKLLYNQKSAPSELAVILDGQSYLWRSLRSK